MPPSPATGTSNGSHRLVRGDTHLPFAQPRFATHCAALLPKERRREREMAAAMIGDTDSGPMGETDAAPDVAHDHDDDESGEPVS